MPAVRKEYKGMHANDEVRGILSFTVESIYDDDRASLLRELNVLVQQDPSIGIAVKSFAEIQVVRGEDELQSREVNARLLIDILRHIGELKIGVRRR